MAELGKEGAQFDFFNAELAGIESGRHVVFGEPLDRSIASGSFHSRPRAGVRQGPAVTSRSCDRDVIIGPAHTRPGTASCRCQWSDPRSVERSEKGGRGGREDGGAGGCAVLLGALWLLFGLASASIGFLNLEELTEMKYGIEILSEPVIRGQSKAGDIVTIASKYKQNYECKLPAVAVQFQQEKDDDPLAYVGLGIAELLKPMEAAPCLTKTKDWWTYEFCYGKHIQQYHIEESELKGDILYLGHYQSEFDWNNETAKASKHHRLKRYHSQMYVNGSKCDLNGQLRETEVRFLCEDGSGDYIARVDEPQSCTYVLTIHTTRICNHPFLRPPSTGSPQPIKCHPALSPEQYVEYVKAQVCKYSPDQSIPYFHQFEQFKLATLRNSDC
ncbi:unnamed protein product [Ranitomeya imitator]|uniref:Endoplasmic reticulum lectin n=1 Tax=Ranitomeya imitator TaxID=111125 RepID=A0ABN9L5R2_9NEOB|nr:unnamed protein product [Ranitomeya imitator]